MTQQITIIANTSVALKPLLESAIRTEVKMLALGLERTRQRLLSFEEQYNMPSTDFEQRFGTGELAESLDFIEWWGELKTHDLLKTQQQALAGAYFN